MLKCSSQRSVPSSGTAPPGTAHFEKNFVTSGAGKDFPHKIQWNNTVRAFGMVKLLLEWPPNVTFVTAGRGRFEPTTLLPETLPPINWTIPSAGSNAHAGKCDYNMQFSPAVGLTEVTCNSAVKFALMSDGLDDPLFFCITFTCNMK